MHLKTLARSTWRTNPNEKTVNYSLTAAGTRGRDLGPAHADAPHRARQAGQRGVAMPGWDRVRLGVAGRDVGDRGRTVGYPVRPGCDQSVEGGGQPRGRLGQLTERVVQSQPLAPAVRPFFDLRRRGHDIAAVGADIDAGSELARRQYSATLDTGLLIW